MSVGPTSASSAKNSSSSWGCGSASWPKAEKKLMAPGAGSLRNSSLLIGPRSLRHLGQLVL
jgi:hypothetical protein